MSSIQLNVIRFTPVNNIVEFPFYALKEKGMTSIRSERIFEPDDEENQQPKYYTNFQAPRQDAFQKEVDLYQNVFFANHYFTYLIYQYFENIQGLVVFANFVKDVEVWIPDSSVIHTQYILYNKFTISPQWGGALARSFQIVLSYNGTSKVLRTPISKIKDFETRKYSKIMCRGKVYHYENTLPSDLKQQLDQLFPVVNLEIKKDFDIYEELKKVNRYPIYHQHLNWFYNQYLNCPSFNKIIKLDAKGFLILPNEWVHNVGKGNNILQFLKGTHINPGLGIIMHKPLQAYTNGHLKLFFIYNKQDADFVKGNMYKFMMEGWQGIVNGKQKHAEPLISYINQPFSFDSTKQTSFSDNNNIYEEVKCQLDKFSLDVGCTYVAIYISPVKKDDKSHPQHNAYYKIKEHLLDKGITSQVIFKEHLDKPDFYYFLPNIYVALLAKMGGIPWLLARGRQEELVIGVGAFKPRDAKHRFLGSAFCFNNKGEFEGFKCFKSNETKILAGSIKDAVEKYIEQHEKVTRIIIHFYKEISDYEELQPILNALDKIGHAHVPVIIVTINKTDSRELLGFDLASPGKMPLSGTYVHVGVNKFLLFNSVRYREDANLLPKDYHFPIKLSIKSTKPEELTSQVKRELIDQVYQFSRMYWKSVSQQNMPVTTIYPQMVAEIFPHFDREKLPEFAEKNLWFL